MKTLIAGVALGLAALEAERAEAAQELRVQLLHLDHALEGEPQVRAEGAPGLAAAGEVAVHEGDPVAVVRLPAAALERLSAEGVAPPLLRAVPGPEERVPHGEPGGHGGGGRGAAEERAQHQEPAHADVGRQRREVAPEGREPGGGVGAGIVLYYIILYHIILCHSIV